jgi:hypothetical protein
LNRIYNGDGSLLASRCLKNRQGLLDILFITLFLGQPGTMFPFSTALKNAVTILSAHCFLQRKVFLIFDQLDLINKKS